MPGDTTIHRSRTGDPTANTLIDRLLEAWEAGSPIPLAELLPLEPAASLIADVACQEISLRLQAGQTVRVADYLAQYPQVAASNELVVYLLDAEVLGRKKYGPPPTLEEYVREFPQFRAELERHFVVTRPVLPESPEGYELLDEIGRGGMGVIYRARDKALKREVAIKVLQDRFVPDSSVGKRFLEEAQITGQLQHPGIPAIHQVGTLADGRPFLAMKLIKGQTLTALIKSQSEINTLGVFESICQAVGYAHERGVIHRDLKPENVMVGAFGEVQVMDWGLAKVIGAKLTTPTAETQAEAPSTAIEDPRTPERHDQTGVAGTPWYMAPEQAAGEQDKIDARTDVFALGGILCAMLTGKPPIEGADQKAAQVNAVRGETAAAIVRLTDFGAELELVTLCKDCLAFLPTDRPASAGKVAMAVGKLRAEADERAKQAEMEKAKAEVRTHAERKRRRVLVGGGLAVGVILLGGIIGTGLGLVRASKAEADERERANGEARANAALLIKEGELVAENARTREAKQKADEQTTLTRRILDMTRIREAGQSLDNNLVSNAISLLEEVAPKNRTSGWRLVRQEAEGGRMTLRGHGDLAGAVAWSPDGKRIASLGVGSDHQLRIWDARTGQLLQTIGRRGAGWPRVQWSPDGRLLATADQEGIFVYRVEGERLVQAHTRSRGQQQSSRWMGWGADPNVLAVVGSDDTIAKWDASTGEERPGLTVKGLRIRRSLAWSPDGKVFAISDSAEIRLVDSETGKVQKTLPSIEWNDVFIAFSPSGGNLAWGGRPSLRPPLRPGVLQIWNPSSQAEPREIHAHAGEVLALAWSPDGRHVATSGDDNLVKVWNARDGQLVSELVGHTGGVMSVSWSPDGFSLASAGDSTVKIWSPFERPLGGASTATANPGVRVLSLGPTEDGVRTLVPHPTATATVQTEVPPIHRHLPELMALAGATALLESWRAEVKQHILLTWANSTKKLRLAPPPRQEPSAFGELPRSLWGMQLYFDEGRSVILGNPAGVWVSDDGGHALTVGETWVWSAADGALLKRFGKTVAPSERPGRSLITLDGLSAVEVPATSLDTYMPPDVAWWNPATGQVATPHEDKSLVIRDPATGATTTLPQAHKLGFTSLAWGPDCTTLVTAGSDQLVKVWDLQTRQLLREYKDRVGYQFVTRKGDRFSRVVKHLLWREEGGVIGVTVGGTVIGWGQQYVPPVEWFRGHTERVVLTAVSDDGTRLASMGMDKTLRVWDTADGRLLDSVECPTDIQQLEWSPSGRLLAGWGQATGMYLWEVSPLAVRHAAPPNAFPIGIKSDQSALTPGAAHHPTIFLREFVWSERSDRMLLVGANGGKFAWNVATGKVEPCDGAIAPPRRARTETHAYRIAGQDILQTSLSVPADELARRTRAARPPAEWHLRSSSASLEAGDRFAAEFHFKQLSAGADTPTTMLAVADLALRLDRHALGVSKLRAVLAKESRATVSERAVANQLLSKFLSWAAAGNKEAVSVQILDELATAVWDSGQTDRAEVCGLTERMAAQMRDRRSPADALPLMKRVFEERKKTLKPNDEQLIRTEFELGVTHEEMGKPELGVPHWEHLLEQAEGQKPTPPEGVRWLFENSATRLISHYEAKNEAAKVAKYRELAKKYAPVPKK